MVSLSRLASRVLDGAITIQHMPRTESSGNDVAPRTKEERDYKEVN